MRVSWRGGGRKPTQLKLTSETFAFKAAALRLYETRDMRVVIRTLWPGIDPDSTTYQSKARVIRRWKSKKIDILGMASKTKTAQLKRYRHAGTAKTLSDDAEMDILEWIIGLRSQGIPVSAKMLQQEALEIASLYDVPRFAFAASPTWMGTFLSRYSLALRAKTRQGQTTPADSARVAREFTATVRRRIVEEGIIKVYNADQTAVFFEYVPKLTIDSRGAKTVWVKCGGKSKERLTAMLLADSTGVKYDPWVVFKVKGSRDDAKRDENTRLRNGFSKGMWKTMEPLQKETQTAIYANPSGWWNAELSLQFLQHFFGERSSADEPVMLMWDDFSAHWTPEVVEFAVEKNIVLQRIPPGYTHCCQPADIAWNKPLKDRIRASWTTYLKAQCSKALVSSGEISPKLIPPDRKRVLQWLHTAWNDLTVKTIKGGYKHVDLLFDERTDFSNEDVGADKIDEELADTLRALSWLDDSAGDVSWDDDVVDRHIHK